QLPCHTLTRPPPATLFPYTTLFRSVVRGAHFTDPELITSRAAVRPGALYRRSLVRATEERLATLGVFTSVTVDLEDPEVPAREKDRKSTRLNSSHVKISYAVFCLKK